LPSVEFQPEERASVINGSSEGIIVVVKRVCVRRGVVRRIGACPWRLDRACVRGHVAQR